MDWRDRAVDLLASRNPKDLSPSSDKCAEGKNTLQRVGQGELGEGRER